VWILRVARVAILMMPIALFVPFDWWAGLAALAVAVAAYRLLRAYDELIAGRRQFEVLLRLGWQIQGERVT
jgi:hypothetical protein